MPDDMFVIRPWDYTGKFTCVPMFHVEQNKELGWCIIQSDKHDTEEFRSAMILYIYIGRQHRRKGYAQALLRIIKENYDELTTMYLDSSPEARRVFERSGFKRDDKYLIWKR